MLKELILEGIAREYLESLFHAGRLEATTYVFQGAIIFHIVIDEVSGFVASIDRDSDVDFEWVVATVEAGIPLGSESSRPS